MTLTAPWTTRYRYWPFHCSRRAYALLCVRDHGGDWAGLDAAITTQHRHEWEPRWSHLLDLRERLDAAGLSAAELVVDAIGQKGLITRARDRVFKQSIARRDMTAPMRHPPSSRLEERARYGRWEWFPKSPQPLHDLLVARFRLDRLADRYGEDGWAAGELAEDLAEAAAALETGDCPGTLAVRRAMLTIWLDLAECCDDSYGHVGELIDAAVVAYVDLDWRAAGLAPAVFWADFLEIVTLLTNYGVANGAEGEVFLRAGAGSDLDVLDEIAAGLQADYTAARMAWHAATVLALHAHALVACGELNRFADAARRIGSQHRRACEVMVAAALDRGRVDVARRTLDACDVPGPNQDWVRKRRAELEDRR